ncbi:MAG: hypothetical protein WB770_11380 [Acidimicrobiales bacterium]
MSSLLSVALVVAPGGIVAEHTALAARSAALAPHVATNTDVVTGKYSGTLKLKDPAKDCPELFDNLPNKKGAPGLGPLLIETSA